MRKLFSSSIYCSFSLESGEFIVQPIKRPLNKPRANWIIKTCKSLKPATGNTESDWFQILPFQVQPKSIFDGVKLSVEKEKLKFLFGAAAMYTEKRPTHSIGVGAQGFATIVAEPQFPECEFFTPGRTFPVCLRHATLKSIDDAMLDFLGASIRFADSDEDSPLDIIMSTGRSSVLSNVQAIYDALKANRSGNVKDFYLDSPDR